MAVDRLTPRERFALLVIDEPQDRAPIFPLVTSHAAVVAGMKLREYYTSGANMARAQIVAQERYGHDFISIFSEVGLIAEALGSQFEYPEDDLPRLSRPKLATVQDFGRLEPPGPTAGRFPVYYDAIGYAFEAKGDRVPVLAFVPAPFTTALHLTDSEEFLLSLHQNPEACLGLLEFVTGVTIEFLHQVVARCGLPVLVDPLASGSVVSPRTYEKFALPFERRLIDFLHRYDLDIILHICGDTMPMLPLLARTNADLISLDRVDLAQARQVLGDRLRLVGAYDTSSLLLKTPAVIEQEVRQMKRQTVDSPKGYVVATGCEVPVRTPFENVQAFIRGAASDW